MKIIRALITCLLLQMNCFVTPTNHEDWLRQCYSECLRNKKDNLNTSYNRNNTKLNLQKLATDISVYKSKNAEIFSDYYREALVYSYLVMSNAVIARMQPRDAVLLKLFFSTMTAISFTQYLSRIGFIAAYDLTHDDAALDSLCEIIDREIKALE